MTKRDTDKKILQYTKKIYGFALSKTKDYDQAQELAQEIVCEVYISLLNSENIANYDGYIYRIASNVYSRFIGKLVEGRKVSCIDDIPVAVNDKYFYDDNKKQLEILKKEIGYLSQRQRSIVYLFYYEKQSVARIAKQLGISANTVKWHLSDARQTLKETIIMSENVRIDEKLALNPINFSFMGSDGTITDKDTEDFFDTRLKQNIAWACYKEPKTVSEIARETGVSTVYIADELKVLVDNGFINQIDNSKNPKYQAMMVISDVRNIQEKEEFYEDDNDSLNKEVAKKLCAEYYTPIFESFEKDPEHWGMSCHNSDVNYMKYSLVMLCQKFLQTNDNVELEREKLKIKRPDGGNYIAHATISNEWQTLNPKKFPNWVMGYMMNWGDDYNSIQVNCRFTDRSLDWKSQVCFDSLSKYIKSGCDKNTLSLEEYEKLCKNGYVQNDIMQVVTMNGGNKSPWDLIEPFMKNFKPAIESLSTYGKELEKTVQKSILESDEPEYAKKYNLILNTGKISNQDLIPYIIEEMLNNGMLKPLDSVQKKAALSILSI